MNIYKALKFIRSSKEPFGLSFTRLFGENAGEVINLENQLDGPLQKNQNQRYMTGIQCQKTGKMRHIYIHSILSITTADNKTFKLSL